MRKRRASTRLAGLGFELAGAVAGFTFVGYWIGRYYGNPELGLLIGALAALFIDVVGRPLTPLSVAGVSRRTARRVDRRN